MTITSDFIEFSDITSVLGNRDIILFGAGEIANKTLMKLDKKPICIVDNNPNMLGTIENNLKVENPEIISNIKNKVLVIICTTSFSEVSEQLEKMGLEKNINFFTSPIINDLLVITRLSNLEKTLLFSSGSPTTSNKKTGGGIYQLTIKGKETNIKKVINGTTHGIIKVDDYYIANNHLKGLIKFDSNFNIINSINLPKGSRPHGLCYSRLNNKYYVAASYRDSIFEISDNFEIEDEIFISKKFSHQGSPVHHCNDICEREGSLFISMFSKSGNWKNDVFDGCIMEFDIKDKDRNDTVVEDLWMPHNVCFIDGGLVVLDSLRGYLLKNNMRRSGHFHGFTRGLLYDGSLYYIGQSRNRNFSKYLGDSLNISIDTSIIIFDDKTKVSRTVHIDPEISEIHAIV